MYLSSVCITFPNGNLANGKKCVEIYEFEEKFLKICALNDERKKLVGACKVTIYVDEDVYLATKWTKAGSSAEFIEIKRKESHDVVRPHNFWTSYRKLS